MALTLKYRYQRPTQVRLRRSAQPAVPFRFEQPGRAPRKMDLVEGAFQTHGRRVTCGAWAELCR